MGISCEPSSEGLVFRVSEAVLETVGRVLASCGLARKPAGRAGGCTIGRPYPSTIAIPIWPNSGGEFTAVSRCILCPKAQTAGFA
jgi:hypothetical protein